MSFMIGLKLNMKKKSKNKNKMQQHKKQAKIMKKSNVGLNIINIKDFEFFVVVEFLENDQHLIEYLIQVDISHVS